MSGESDFEAARIQWEAECRFLGHVVPWPVRKRGGWRMKAEPLDKGTIDGVKRAIRCGTVGINGAITRATGITRQTLQNALWGLPVMRSTKLLLERWLEEHEARKDAAQ